MRFWIAGHLLGRHLDAEVAARHHHGVGLGQDLVQATRSPRASPAWRRCRRGPAMIAWASTMSSGAARTRARPSRCPASGRSRDRARSFVVIAESGSTTPGTLTPLRSESMPPLMTGVSAKSLPDRSTRRRSRPSSSSSSVPRARARRRFPGAAAGRVSRRPACRGRGRGGRRRPRPAAPDHWRKCRRAASGPADRAARRSGGRCRASIERIRSRRCLWSACVPWLKFRRNTSAPA